MSAWSQYDIFSGQRRLYPDDYSKSGMGPYSSLPTPQSTPVWSSHANAPTNNAFSDAAAVAATDGIATTSSTAFPYASNECHRDVSAPEKRVKREPKSVKKLGRNSGRANSVDEDAATHFEPAMGPIEAGAKEYSKFHWTDAEGKRLLLAYCKTVQEEFPDFPYDRLVENFKQGLPHGDLVTMAKIRKYLTKVAFDVKQANLPVPTVHTGAAKIPTNLLDPQSAVGMRRRSNGSRLSTPFSLVQEVPETPSKNLTGANTGGTKRTQSRLSLTANSKRGRRQGKRTMPPTRQRTSQNIKCFAVVTPSDDDTEEEIVEDTKNTLPTPHDHFTRGFGSTKVPSRSSFTTSAGPAPNKTHSKGQTINTTTESKRGASGDSELHRGMSATPAFGHSTSYSQATGESGVNDLASRQILPDTYFPGQSNHTEHATGFDLPQTSFENSIHGQSAQNTLTGARVPFGQLNRGRARNHVSTEERLRCLHAFSDGLSTSGHGPGFHFSAEGAAINSPTFDSHRRTDSGVDLGHIRLWTGDERSSGSHGNAYMSNIFSNAQSDSSSRVVEQQNPEQAIEENRNDANFTEERMDLDTLANGPGQQGSNVYLRSPEEFPNSVADDRTIAEGDTSDFSDISDRRVEYLDPALEFSIDHNSGVNGDVEQHSSVLHHYDDQSPPEGGDKNSWVFSGESADQHPIDGTAESSYNLM